MVEKHTLRSSTEKISFGHFLASVKNKLFCDKYQLVGFYDENDPKINFSLVYLKSAKIKKRSDLDSKFDKLAVLKRTLRLYTEKGQFWSFVCFSLKTKLFCDNYRLVVGFHDEKDRKINFSLV